MAAYLQKLIRSAQAAGSMPHQQNTSFGCALDVHDGPLRLSRIILSERPPYGGRIGLPLNICGMRFVCSYIVMTNGARAGTQFLLDPARPNRVGRGLDCDVILTDPLSSRVHALVVCQDGDWWVRDAGSRNGTYVSGQK